MTLQPTANRQDVLGDAGVYGWDGHWINSLPDYAEKSTSGGASVSSDNLGTKITAGTTGGDQASVDSGWSFLSGPDIGRGEIESKRTIVWAPTSFGGQSTDEIYIGYVDGTEPTAGIDLLNGQYVVEGTTEPATLPNKIVTTEIAIDEDANETTFTTVGDVNETVTVQGRPRKWNNLIITVSNGGGDEVRVLYDRFKFEVP